MAGMVKWFKSYGLLFLIIAIGLGLRFINLREWFHFEFDEEVIAWKLREFVTTGKPFLIGGGTPFGFHLGPAFYYLSAIPLWFSRLDPIGWGIVAAVFGTATVYLMWLVGKTLYNQRIGLTAALLWATSFTAVMSDRHWWPLVLDPMLSLIVILCLYRICVIPAKADNVIPAKARFDSARRAGIYSNRFSIKSGMTMTWLILGLVLAFAWQADLTVLPLFLAAGVIAVLNFRRQWKGILAAVGVLAVSFLPLVFFELRHPGANFGQLAFSHKRLDLLWLEFFKTIAFVPAVLGGLLFPVTNLDGNLLNFYTWCKDIADGRVNGQPWWASLIVTVLLIFPFVIPTKVGIYLNRFRIKSGMTRNPESDLILRILILSGIGGIFIFRSKGGNLYDFYLAVLYPVVILSVARVIYFIWEKWGKITAVSAIGVIVGLNLFVIFKSYHPQSLALKQQAVAWTISNIGKEEFDLESISNCSRYNGVRYLFLLGGKEPQSSFVDQDLSWLYDKRNDYMKPKYLVTFVTPDDLAPEQNKQYNKLKQGSINSKIFSPGLEVIISEHD